MGNSSFLFSHMSSSRKSRLQKQAQIPVEPSDSGTVIGNSTMARIMFRTSFRKDESRAIKPSSHATAIECQHTYNKSHKREISSLPRPLACTEAPNAFGEDADQYIIRRKDSTGADLLIKSQLSRSSSLDCDKLAALGDITSHGGLQHSLCDRLETYYPLHQGPNITVSSADGTTLSVDNESDTTRNAAAQALFRALNRRHTAEGLETLDGHMNKIFGTVELNLEVKEMETRNRINVSNHDWDIQSMHAVIEGNSEGAVRKRARRMKEKWNRWVAKVFS